METEWGKEININSPKLFITGFESIFQKSNWERMEVKQNIWTTYDFLISGSLDKLQEMPNDLNKESLNVGFKWTETEQK